MTVWKKWSKLSLFTRIMVGFVLGIVCGLIMGPKASVFNFLGTILVRLLTMVVAPLVLCLLVCAAADVGDYKKLGKIGLKTVVIFLVSTGFAIVIGLLFAHLIGVGTGVVIQAQNASESAVEIPSALDTLINIIPNNPFEALSTQNLLQIIFFALFFGFALIKLGEKGQVVLGFFQGCTEAMKEITSIVLEFTPYGVFGLMANVVGINGLAILLPYMKTILAVYLASAIYTVLVQAGLMVGVCAHMSPLKFLKGVKEAAMFVFATCSSVATIPINLKCTKKLGVSDEIANFVIPFGAVMNMNGTAIYEAVAVIFTAQVYGIELTMMQQIMVMLTATLASIGTAGVPGSGLVMLTIVLSSVNLPMEAIGLLAGIDRILNMGRVIPNIVGDAATAVLVAKSEGVLQEAADIE
ncbi:MAG TPA: dicarboxylate/amino acid:cation symporter [Candidatus Ventrimonas merdavium]|nr:dicarboxylate/amino acid:cation symporter [Candidatus Ventrimonas merdavium]